MKLEAGCRVAGAILQGLLLGLLLILAVARMLERRPQATVFRYEGY